jgi:hypothetical protein
MQPDIIGASSRGREAGGISTFAMVGSIRAIVASGPEAPGLVLDCVA